jgi:uncharacterized LabA/DUF88 family protein
MLLCFARNPLGMSWWRPARYGSRAFSFGGSVASPRRFIAYVDGFNMYHALDELARPHLKWLDLAFLCRKFVSGLGGELHAPTSLLAVHWFTAFPENMGKDLALKRHRLYRDALEAQGVKTVPGRFRRNPDKCKGCGLSRPVEKETDVNIALAMTSDADAGAFDHALLVSGDSDQVPSVRRVVRARGPGSVRILVPPGRDIPYELGQAAGSSDRYVTKIRLSHLEGSLLPASVARASGAPVSRPVEYRPPTS